jgi:capsular exopolysaccharide synthesis family protein
MWPFRSRRQQPAPTDQPTGTPGSIVAMVDDMVDPRVVVYHDPAGQQAEQYRGFRTNLRAMNPQGGPRTLLFTSAQPREGKSVTVVNIACALAESAASRVCLVDADLRGGQLHRLLGCLGTPGLADVLLDGVPPRRALQQTPLTNLTLLPAGRAVENPGELFTSAYLQELISVLKREHKYVLFDSPPVLAFADACELGRLTDGVLLIVAIEETRRRDAERSLANLADAGAHVVGTFVTGALPRDEDRPTVPDAEDAAEEAASEDGGPAAKL